MAATVQTAGQSSGSDQTFVGRANELAAFDGAFGQVLEGQRKILALAGEPGIGKTRLAEALARAAEDQGALVLWGRCYEEPGAPPYWPWVQIIREFAGGSSPTELRRLMGDGAPQLVTLAPGLEATLGAHDAEHEAPFEAGHARFRTFDACGRFLRRVAAQVPLVLIVDNAHWADQASLALLEFLAQELVNSRLLVVCTYRDTEISRSNPLLATLGELCRGSGMERLRLGGLDKPAIRELARRMLGRDPPPAVIDAIDQQTDGNPLFVIELLKVLIEESRDAGIEPIAVRIPDGVRETIGRRLDRLSDSVNELLRAASVLGVGFEARELVLVADLDIRTVLEAMHLAESTGFVESGDDPPHAYRFTHALIRETLYDEIPTPERLRLHGLAGDALASLDAQDEHRRLSQIAHHYYESAALGHVEQALDYAARAGHAAMRLDAYEEAVIQYDRVLTLLTQYATGSEDERRQAIFWKSRALLGTGEVAKATTVLLESIGDTDSVEDAEWLVDVVTQWGILRSDDIQDQQLPLLRKVLEWLPEGDSAARAKALAARAFAERTLGSKSGIREGVEESVAMARRLGDVDVLSHCLRSAFFALRGDPAHLEIRLSLGAEFLSIAPARDQCERRAEAFYQQALNLIDAGKMNELDRLLDDYENIRAARMGMHEYRSGAFRIVGALLRGEYAGLSERIERLREIGHKSRGEDADGVYGAQMFALHRDLGRLEPFASLIERFSTARARPAWAPGLMLALTEIGRLDEAKRELERLAADGFTTIPDDDMRVTALIYAAETCAALDDASRARQLYDLLTPHAATFANHPTAVSFGSTELYLGMLAGAMDEIDTARGHFEAAIQANSAARAWPWVARACHRFAIALRRSGRPDDRARADELLLEAEQLADSLGMAGLSVAVNALLRGQEAGAAFPDGLTPREVDVLRLLAIGRSNKDIAKVLSISLNTVATHVRNILTKTDCANRTEAAAYVGRNDLVETH